jgi:hypothetical protein
MRSRRCWITTRAQLGKTNGEGGEGVLPPPPHPTHSPSSTGVIRKNLCKDDFAPSVLQKKRPPIFQC